MGSTSSVSSVRPDMDEAHERFRDAQSAEEVRRLRQFDGRGVLPFPQQRVDGRG